jgi:hypothetical protein
MSDYGIEDIDELETSIYDDKDIAIECISSHGYEYDFVDFVIDRRFEGYDARDIVSEFVNIEKSDAGDIIDNFSHYVDAEGVIDYVINDRISYMSDDEIIELIYN